ncbi:MAG: preprotein translocase subunit SecG [Candidatus Vogelbacteria bacterium CG10_big_fil_rev_8_21_14_0_10_51_16]|uniref:Protein-export membrane protein SecG n=1 Tax=Candidatus Vogelbacteria bacterium CG10_big_fil_rev_8_21_14_0_10_51_16 TaxID=1975045 RepID=A0A2H0REL6_9BACT|nr:MAG: preprotein translocase subunit SecG [Candidatus Vogelbacteria bacterium CG10_big_fil_rev_8_21_14_0_10_51_16]
MDILRTTVPYIQIGLAVILVVLVLLQQNESSLGSAFGGSGESSFRTKRGAEKTLFLATIVVSILFVAIAVISLVL